MADRKPKSQQKWPEILVEAIARGRRSRRELAAALERDASLISLYCSGRSVPRLSDRKLIDTLARFLQIDSGRLEDLILAYRPSGGKRGQTPQRIESVADLRRTVECDISGVLRNLVEAEGSGDALAGRLREWGYEVPSSADWESIVAGVRAKSSSTGSDTDSRLLSIGPGIDGNGCDTNPEINRASEIETALTLYGRINERDLSVRDSVRAACRALEELFLTNGDEVSRKEILDILLARFAWCASEEVQRLHAHAILEALVACHYLQPEERVAADSHDQLKIRRRWRLTASFVVNWLFGYSLAVRRLDFLLDGGLLLPGKHGLAILATGRPGAGKTTLILQIAASLSAEGFVGIFLTAEEHTSSLLDKLSYMGYERAPARQNSSNRPDASILLEQRQAMWERFQGSRGRRETSPKKLHVFCTEDLADASLFQIEERNDTGLPPSGCLILTGVSDRNSFASHITADPGKQGSKASQSLLDLKQLLDYCRARHRSTVVVIDSLEAVMPLRPEADQGRRIVEALFDFARNNATITLLAGEKHTDDQVASFAEYLTDMHIHLGHTQGAASATTSRSLSIMKSRHQSIIRGEHAYAIHGGYGVDCYPSIRAQLSVARRRVRPKRVPGDLTWKLPELDFTGLLQRDVVKGDCVLLTGPSGTHKFLVGLSFLASAIEDSDGGDVLLISLRQDLPAVLRVIEAHPQFSKLLSSPDASELALNERVKLLYPPPDYFSGSRFYEWMRTVFRKSRDSGQGISRVLIHTMDQFKANSPLIAEDPMFFSLLIEYFKAHNATSLFVLAEEADKHSLPGADVFDAVLKTAKDEPSGRVLFAVGHSGPCNAWAQSATLTHGAEEPKLRLLLSEKPPLPSQIA